MLRAQKDLTIKVLNNSTTRIDKTEVRSIGRNRFQETAGNDTLHIGGSLNITVFGSRAEPYAAGPTGRHWEGIRHIAYQLNFLPGKGNFQVGATRNLSLSSGENTALSSGRSRSDYVAKDHSSNSGGNAVSTITGSSRGIIGKKMFVDVVEGTQFWCGSSVLKMDAARNINLKGVHIRMNARKIDLA